MGWDTMGDTRRVDCARSEIDGRFVRSPSDSGALSVVRSRDLVPCRATGARRKHVVPSTGDRFGSLTVTGYLVSDDGGLRRIVVQCDCGRPEHDVDCANLRSGRSTRCAKCARPAGTRTRKRWWGYADVCPDDEHRMRLLNRISAIVQRCHNPKSRGWRDYGGRGIKAHEAWRSDRRSFLAYLLTLDGWDTPELELDRIDNDRGYEPGNLRFVSRARNAANKRSVRTLSARIRELETRVRSCTCGAAQSIHDRDG